MPSSTDPARRRPAPTRSTVAIVACLAVLALLLTGLIASFALRDDDPGPTVEKIGGNQPPTQGKVDVDAFLDATITAPDGTDTTLRDQLGGTPLLVNLWSKTCAPCVREMPWLDAIATADRSITVIGVNQQDRPEAAAAMAKQTGISYPWYRDPTAELGYAARTSFLPDTVLLAPDGRVLATKLGAFADQAAIEQWIADHRDGTGS